MTVRVEARETRNRRQAQARENVLLVTSAGKAGTFGFDLLENRFLHVDWLKIVRMLPDRNCLLPSVRKLFKDVRVRNFRWKGKANAAVNPNLLKIANRSVPSSAVSDGKKRKDTLADVVEKADGKRKKDKKEEKDDKFCKPGEWGNYRAY